MSDTTTPVDIAIDLKKRTVQIVWQDGKAFDYGLDLLRKECPCASCKDLRNQQSDDPLRVLSADQAITRGELDPENPVQVVGQYALQFYWDDGHRTGIYTYRFLRDLGEKVSTN
ncbi:MAG: DUF971 domain-containing protein [Chloroflexota bacterium]